MLVTILAHCPALVARFRPRLELEAMVNRARSPAPQPASPASMASSSSGSESDGESSDYTADPSSSGSESSSSLDSDGEDDNVGPLAKVSAFGKLDISTENDTKRISFFSFSPSSQIIFFLQEHVHFDRDSVTQERLALEHCRRAFSMEELFCSAATEQLGRSVPIEKAWDQNCVSEKTTKNLRTELRMKWVAVIRLFVWSVGHVAVVAIAGLYAVSQAE